MYKIFLDDLRKPPNDSFTVVKNYDEFIEHILRLGLPTIISFDHDLAPEHYSDLLSKQQGTNRYDQISLNYHKYKEKTGYDCAKWLVNHCTNNQLKLPMCVIHSQNPAGAENIKAYINTYLKVVEDQYPDCMIINWSTFSDEEKGADK
jgi:hypothetical protein